MIYIADFIKSDFSGISAFSRRISAGSEMIKYLPIEDVYNRIRRSQDTLVINFPSMSFGNLLDLFRITLLRLLGLRIIVIVHEFQSQSRYGRTLVFLLALLSKKILLVTPSLETSPLARLFSAKCSTILQGCNFENSLLESSKYHFSPSKSTDLVIGFNGALSNFDLSSVHFVLLAVGRVAPKFAKVKVVFLGSRVDELPDHIFVNDEVKIFNFNKLEAADYVTQLIHMDIIFLPFKDGITLRRSSLIAALCAGINVVTSKAITVNEETAILNSPLKGIVFSDFSISDIEKILLARQQPSPLTSDEIATAARSYFSYRNYIEFFNSWDASYAARS